MTKKKGVAPVNIRRIILLPILLSLGWLMIIVTDYLFHHPYYTQGISQFSYWGLLAVLSVVSFAGYYFSRSFNGIKIYLFLLLFMNIILARYGITNGLFESNPLVHLLYFSGFVIMLHAAVLYIVVVGYAIGNILLRPFAGYFSESSHKIIAIALGLSLMGFIMVVLGLLNGLRPWILWPVFILATAFQYRSIGRFLKGLFFSPLPKDKLKTEVFLAGALLIIFAAVNCIGAIKAFPIGFDGSALYMNTTKLISEYQALPKGGQAFNWSVIMSLGNLLFGSTTVSILLSHLAGLICLPVIYRIARLFVAPGNALLAAALFYTAPAITFHNFFDEKVDLGFLFISLSTLLFLLEFFLKKRKENTLKKQQFPIKIGRLVLSTDLLLWIYAGWLTGFAFGIKYIALFNGIALVVLLFYKKGGRIAFLGSLVAALSFIFYLGVYRFTCFELDGMSPVFLGSLLFIPGMALMWWAFRQSSFDFLRTGGIAFAFLIAAGFAYSPWCIKHFLENKSVSISALVEGKSPQPNIFVGGRYRKKMQNPDASKLNNKQNSPKEKAIKPIATKKTRREELQRYRGFEKGLPLYISLPYDLTMNTNLPGLPFLDIGFLWLLLLPLLCFSAKPRNNIKNLLLLLVIGLMLFVSLLSVYVTKVKPVLPGKLVDAHPEGFREIFGDVYISSIDLLISLAENARGIFDWLTHFDFATCLAALLLLLGAILLMAYEKIKMMPVLLKELLAFIVVYLLLWLLLGSGVPWYAFTALAVLPVLAVYYFEYPEQFLGSGNTRFSQYFLGFGFCLYFCLNLSLHFSDPDRGNDRHLIFKKPFIQYATRSMTWEETLAGFNPFYLEALEHLNSDPSAKIYRVGTYMQYHITKNDQRVLEDNQLGHFEVKVSKLSDPNYFLQVLRKNGFRYILYDLRSANIDKTPERSLVQKNIDFVNLLLNPNEIKLVATDRIVEDPKGGVVQLPDGTLPGRPGLSGKVILKGSFALFEIL